MDPRGLTSERLATGTRGVVKASAPDSQGLHPYSAGKSPQAGAAQDDCIRRPGSVPAWQQCLTARGTRRAVDQRARGASGDEGSLRRQ